MALGIVLPSALAQASVFSSVKWGDDAWLSGVRRI